MCGFEEKSVPKVDAQLQRAIGRLKAARENANLSQMELSFRAGLSQNLVNYIENGQRTPNLYTVLKICNALDLDPARLFSPEDEERQRAQETIISLARRFM
jgi:transcriptional regulator with XRE-family HTH domain